MFPKGKPKSAVKVKILLSLNLLLNQLLFGPIKSSNLMMFPKEMVESRDSLEESGISGPRGLGNGVCSWLLLGEMRFREAERDLVSRSINMDHWGDLLSFLLRATL